MTRAYIFDTFLSEHYQILLLYIAIWDYLLMPFHPLNSELSEGMIVFALIQHYIPYI